VRSLTRSNAWGASLQWSGSVAGRFGTHRLASGVASDSGATDFEQTQTPALITAAREIVDAGAALLGAAAHTVVSQSGVYALDSIALDERTTVMASARYQQARVRIEDRSGVAPELAGSHRFARTNPALGMTFAPVPATSLYANWSQGMRVPTAMELTCADPDAPCSLPNIFVADPPLKAVIATTIEAGVRQRWATGTASLALYRSRLRDDIQFIATAAGSGSAGYFTNVGTTERLGVELGGSTTLAAVTVDARYAYTRATFRSAFSAHSPANALADAQGAISVLPGNRMPGVPEHVLKVHVAWAARAGLELGATLAAASHQFARGNENSADPTGRVPGYAVLDLDLRWQPAAGWELAATIANVLDRRYATFGTLGVDLFTGEGGTYAATTAQPTPFFGPGAPRAAWLTLRHTFGAT
jgi:outer membrane receptor protein involved in Fe transport